MKVVFNIQHIGKNIRNERITKKMNIKTLSNKTKISVSSLYRYEKGIVVPNLKSIIKLCNCLDAPIDGIVTYYLI